MGAASRFGKLKLDGFPIYVPLVAVGELRHASEFFLILKIHFTDSKRKAFTRRERLLALSFRAHSSVESPVVIIKLVAADGAND